MTTTNTTLLGNIPARDIFNAYESTDGTANLSELLDHIEKFKEIPVYNSDTKTRDNKSVNDTPLFYTEFRGLEIPGIYYMVIPLVLAFLLTRIRRKQKIDKQRDDEMEGE